MGADDYELHGHRRFREGSGKVQGRFREQTTMSCTATEGGRLGEQRGDVVVKEEEQSEESPRRRREDKGVPAHAHSPVCRFMPVEVWWCGEC